MIYDESKAELNRKMFSSEEKTNVVNDAPSHSLKFLRQRKFLLVLPILVLPFLTMAFWALGGGKEDNKLKDQKSLGLNGELPDANLKDERNLDKLSFYQKADEDSLKRREMLRNDPYYKNDMEKNASTTALVAHAPNYSGLNISPYNNNLDANEQKIYQKINELNTHLNRPLQQQSFSDNSAKAKGQGEDHQFSKEVDRIQKMMELMNNKKEVDPEMQQLNGTLEKILDIQHPERIKDKIRETSAAHKGQVYTVNSNSNNELNSLLTTPKAVVQTKQFNSQFYSLDENAIDKVDEENTIKAAVHQSQILVDGSIVKLRLLNEVFINGNLIPKDNFVFGTATLIGERLLIKINSIRYKNSIYPVNLSVSDIDGLAGIYIPGAITRDVAKQSTERAVQGVGLTSLDPSLKVQAASAGIEAAKTLLSKKAKLIKVMVKAGYQVLLTDERQKASF